MKYFFLSLFSVLLWTGCSSNEEEPNPPTNPEPPVTHLIDAPSFSLSADDGGSVSLGDFQGDVLVIFFFGNSCPPCKGVAPRIESDLNQAFSSNDKFSIIGIDQWDGNQASVQSFRSSTGVTFPLGLMGSQVARAYGTTFDRLVVINKEGKIAFSGNSQATNDLNRVIQEVTTLLAE